MDPEHAIARLQAEKDDLLRASGGARESRGPVALDQQSVGRLSRMDAMQVQAMAIETERRRRARLQALDAALKRMEAGTFGICVRCGEDVEARRLELDPATPLCLDCARGGSAA